MTANAHVHGSFTSVIGFILSPFVAAILAAWLVRRFPHRAGARHELKVSLPAETVMLRADPVRLTQMLVNVLNNAAKFTPPGGHIYVIAETVGEADGHPDQLRIRIRDDGIGIAPELRPKIFDMFAQGDRSLERTRGGLGVGLTLVRNLAHLHGGSVDVRSDGVDSGTEVILDLPIEQSARAAADDSNAAPPAASARSLRILVADDNEDGREMMRYFLEGEGHTVATAGDGPSALAAVEEFRPEVAVLDIGMPGLNGYKVVGRRMSVRQKPRPIAGQHFNRHASLSTWPGEDDLASALASHLRLALLRPVSSEEIATAHSAKTTSQSKIELARSPFRVGLASSRHRHG